MAEFTIDLVARFAQFQDALERIGRESEKSGKRIERAFNDAGHKIKEAFAIFGVSLGAEQFVEFTKQAIEAVDQLGKVAQRTGIAVEALSSLRVAAALNEVTFEQLTVGLQHFNQAVDKGSPAFRRLGIDLNQFKTPEEKLNAVADAFEKTKDGAAKTAVAIEIFGRAGAALIPLLNEGSEGLRKYHEEAERLGVAFGPEQARRAQEFNDNLTRTKLVFEGLAVALGNQLLPKLNEFIDALLRAKDAAGNFDLDAFVSNALINAITNATENVTRFRVRLKELREERERFIQLDKDSPLSKQLVFGGAKLEDIDKAIATVEKRLKAAELAQRAMALAGASDKDLDARDLLLRGQNRKDEKRDIAPDPQDEIQRNRARLQQRIEAARQAAQEEQRIEDTAFARSERTNEDHFKNLTAIARREIHARIAALDEGIAAEASEAAKTAKDTPERLQRELTLIKLRGERGRLTQQLDIVERANSDKLRDAQAQYVDQIEATNAALKEQAGFSEAAVIKRQNLLEHLRAREKLVLESGPQSQAVRDFDERDRQERQQARLNELLQIEETQRKNTNAQIIIADNARGAEAGSLDAEIRFLKDRNRILRESIPLQQAAIDRRETELAQTPAGPARDALQADLGERRAQLDAVRVSTTEATAALELYGLEERKLGVILQEEATAEADIQNQREAGAITTQDALAKTDAIRRKYVESLRVELAAEEELAKARPFDEELQARINATRVAIERLAATSNQVAKQSQTIFENAFVQPFEDLINHVKTADEALKAFFNNIAQSFLHLISQNLSERLFGSLFGTSAGGGGDVIGSIFGLFSGATGGGTVSASNRMALGGVMTEYGPLKLERYASGGVAMRPQLAMFGEGRRPEAFVPLPDGRSIPVSLKGFDSSQVTTAIPPTLAQTQRGPKGQQGGGGAVVLQIHPDAMHMTLRDWFEGEMARQAATR